MKILDLLNDLRESLPVQQQENSEFIKNVKDQQQLFLKKINQVDVDDLKLFLPNRDKAISKKMLQFRFEKITNLLIDVLNYYYNGYPDESYKAIKKLLKNVSFITKLSDSYEGFLLIKDLRMFEKVEYYRIREIKPIESVIPAKKDLFHAPFEKRGKVSTSRFSIPGFPCLYLGRSLQVCFLETNSKDYIYASRFEINADQTYTRALNLTIPDIFTDSIYDNESDKNYDAFCFLLTYPIIQICLFKVKTACENDNFKPEYIIPQLMLQFVRKEGYFNSILYTSTKVTDNISDEDFQNLVLPIQQISKEGYCSILKSRIKLTKPIGIANSTVEEIKLANDQLISCQVEQI